MVAPSVATITERSGNSSTSTENSEDSSDAVGLEESWGAQPQQVRSRVPKNLPSYVGADRQRDAGVPSGGSIETRRVRPNKRFFGGAGAEPPRTARSAGHLGKNTDRVSPPKSALAVARELTSCFGLLQASAPVSAAGFALRQTLT